MQIKRGEIWYIEPTWKEKGDEMVGNHPGVVVSNDDENGRGHTFEVVFLTTKPQDPERPSDVRMRSSGREATALCHQVTSVSEERFTSLLGRASEEEMRRIEVGMMIALGLEHKDEEDPVEMIRRAFELVEKVRAVL